MAQDGTKLHRTVRAHLKTFLAEMEGEGVRVCRGSSWEFERYLGCGILANGFAQDRCTAYGDELLARVEELRE